MASIHGHEVIEMIAAVGRPLSRTDLLDEIGRRFGPDARFHTCSAEDLSAAELVDFLVTRGKLHGSDHALALDPSKVCQH
jgi:probable metal-binding protein